jgi:c-di-GMP-binding flagellar brake protein YcgR
LQKENKRRFRRIDLHAPVRYQVRGKPDFGSSLSDNISEGGLALNALNFIPPSSAVMLEISLLSRILRPIARVSWCQPVPHSDNNRLGLEFIELNAADRNFLSEYINIRPA